MSIHKQLQYWGGGDKNVNVSYTYTKSNICLGKWDLCADDIQWLDYECQKGFGTKCSGKLWIYSARGTPQEWVNHQTKP